MRDLLIKDLGWKLFSLFLALTIWLTVHKISEESEIIPAMEAGPTVTIEGLPVTVVSSTADVHDFRVGRAVTVTVGGPAEAMTNLETGQIRALVDLTDVTNLANAKTLTRPVAVLTPEGVSLISVTPSSVDILPPPRH